MIGRKTCIVCLPRTGSQLCEQLISEVHDSYTLGEYFEDWNRSNYEFDADNNIYVTKFIGVSCKLNLQEHFKEKLNLLSKANPNQPLTLRLFLMDYYSKDTLSTIITELKTLGFEFVTLTRDIKNQLLSFMITVSYQTFKKKNVFGINSDIIEPIYIKLNVLGPIFDDLVNSFKNWEDNLSIILNDVNYQKIKYDTIYNDMEQIYNTNFKYHGKKSIKGDPLDLILNKNEVVNFLSSRGIN